MEKQKTRELAEKIALLLQENGTGSDDARFFRESLEKINQRLENIESQLNSPTRHSALNAQHSNFHPSQERFLNVEAIANEIIENLQNEKACPYEPTGKPCDNCAMCSSRGF
jgi:hypothetical protein